MKKKPGGWADVVHHVLSFSGRSGKLACGGEVADYDEHERSIHLDDVDCKSCLEYWDQRYLDAVEAQRKDDYFADGPMVI